MHQVSELGARKVVSFGCVSLMLFGLTTALGALVPMTCMPSVQPTCTAGGLALNGPGWDLIYTALNVVANVGIEVSMLLFGLGRASLKRWEITGRTGWVLLFLSAPHGILDAYFLFKLPNLVGLPQRALLILQSAWIVAIAATLIGKANRSTT